MALRKGENVRGKRDAYTIVSLVDSGGLGRIWKAKAENGTTVACKEPLTGTPQDALNLEKLQIEAVVLEKLTGRKPMLLSQQGEAYDLEPRVRGHIVQFLDVDRTPRTDTRTLVLQFVEGKTTEKKYRTNSGESSLSLNQVDQYAVAILSIVKALHENNVLHRDISPHNLMCTEDVRCDPVLIDFGTAKEGFNQISSSGLSSIIKTGYSPPELVYGLASPSSDLYSVAATVLFLYTGMSPQYLINSKFQLEEMHRAFHRIPDERRQILRKGLSYYQADRYQTADDMLNAFAGKPIVALTSKPHIVASGRKYELGGTMIIGRQHTCNQDCQRRGFWQSPDIAIIDPQSYVGRHHAKLQSDPSGVCWIEHIDPVNRTAVRRATGHTFEVLSPRKGYKLTDGDTIALAYSPAKGPYTTVSYHRN